MERWGERKSGIVASLSVEDGLGGETIITSLSSLLASLSVQGGQGGETIITSLSSLVASLSESVCGRLGEGSSVVSVLVFSMSILSVVVVC